MRIYCNHPSAYIFERDLKNLVVRNGHHDDTYYNEIGLYVQNRDTVPTGSSVHKIWEGLWRPLKDGYEECPL
jgi:hypothetical protein